MGKAVCKGSCMTYMKNGMVDGMLIGLFIGAAIGLFKVKITCPMVESVIGPHHTRLVGNGNRIRATCSIGAGNS